VYRIDRARVDAFLRAQGLTGAEIASLSIQIAESGKQFGLSEKTRCSYCPHEHTIYIYTQAQLPAHTMNISFLHELRHHWQVMRNEINLAWLDLPYRDRPHEIDARTFANEHQNTILIHRRKHK
jgi:hypothetical protein